MRNIVVPIDFSPESVKALQKAIFMARKMDGAVHMIHVNKVKTFLFGGYKTTEDPDDIDRSFKELMTATPHEGIELNYSIQSGNVTKEVAKFADKLTAHLIVVGTHGATGFSENWMGSNAYRIVTHSSCPVLSMRGEDGFLDVKKIVLPIDTYSGTRQKVPFTMELAQMFNAEIHVLGTCIDETDVMQVKIQNYMLQVARVLKENGLKVEAEYVTGNNIANLTMDYAKEVNADLISIMTEMESKFSNTFMGTFAQQIVHRSTIPVLTMHENPDMEGNVSIM